MQLRNEKRGFWALTEYYFVLLAWCNIPKILLPPAHRDMLKISGTGTAATF